MTTELRISDQKLDDTFLDNWALQEYEAPRYDPREIRTVTLDHIEFDDHTWYDIFQGLVNIREFNIFNSRLNSKILRNLISAINPYSLSKLDLSTSVFDSFDENDLVHLNSLFSVDLILPESMDLDSRQILAKIFSHGRYTINIEIKEPEA